MVSSARDREGAGAALGLGASKDQVLLPVVPNPGKRPDLHPVKTLWPWEARGSGVRVTAQPAPAG